jgi:hypothetical protein
MVMNIFLRGGQKIMAHLKPEEYKNLIHEQGRKIG